MNFSADSDFWAVTTYFNPNNSANRRLNFQQFCEFVDLPLLVIELSPSGRCTLGTRDNVQVHCCRGNPHLWQKERLINQAISLLPRHARYVAWLDCDIIMEDDSWVDFSRDILRISGGLVQPFSGAHQICPNQQPRGLSRKKIFSLPTTDYSQSFGLAHANKMTLSIASFSSLVDTWTGKESPVIPLERTRPQTGFAWAARKEDLQRVGLYEYFIVGGGDRAMCFAAAGHTEIYLSERRLTNRHRKHYQAWAQSFAELVGGTIHYAPCKLRHLWHGTTENRQYLHRFNLLMQNQYDPLEDVRISEEGALDWTNPRGKLATDVKGYFEARKEDD